MGIVLKTGVRVIGLFDMILGAVFGVYLFAIFTPYMGVFARVLSWQYVSMNESCEPMNLEEAFGVLAGVGVLLLLFSMSKIYLGHKLWNGAAASVQDELQICHTWLIGTGLLWVLNLGCSFALSSLFDAPRQFLNAVGVYQTFSLVSIYIYWHTQKLKIGAKLHDDDEPAGGAPVVGSKGGLQKV